MADKHPNSKKITIFRAGSFINDAQTNAQEFMSMSKKSIGSYFIGNGSKGIGSGLEFEEIDVLMPLVLDLPKEDRTFRAKVRQYFTEIVTRVPHGTGVELEIGLKLDNNRPVTFKNEEGLYNLPINISDFIRYHHAKSHPRVGASKAVALGNMLVEFYIFDKDVVLGQNVAASKAKDEALLTYLQLKETPEKVDMMLTLLKVDPRTFTGAKKEDLKAQKLRELADANADVFMTTFKQDNFEYRYQVQTMVNTGVLKQVGSQFVDAETGDIIGHTFEEAIYFLRDETKSNEVSILKARMQESLKGNSSKSKNKPVTA